MRRRIVALLFFPAGVFLWMIGWCIYYIGLKSAETRKPIIRSEAKDDTVEIVAMFPEKDARFIDS